MEIPQRIFIIFFYFYFSYRKRKKGTRCMSERSMSDSLRVDALRFPSETTRINFPSQKSPSIFFTNGFHFILVSNIFFFLFSFILHYLPSVHDGYTFHQIIYLLPEEALTFHWRVVISTFFSIT